MKPAFLLPVLIVAAAWSGCASTRSYTPTQSSSYRSGPTTTVLPFTGFAGDQASDMVTEEMEKAGFNVIDARGQADYVMSGTCSALSGPLYSFPHVSMTARVVDARTSKILWMGRYGNPAWTSAVSTQGDIQRGARDLVNEMKKTLGNPANIPPGAAKLK